jgi:hypothetical protein
VKRAVIITVLLGFVLAAAGVAGMRYSKVFAQAAASDAKFVGADKCKGCHAKQYADYEAENSQRPGRSCRCAARRKTRSALSAIARVR